MGNKKLILAFLLVSILLVSGCVTGGGGTLKATFSNLPTWTMGVFGTFPLTVEGGTPPYICAITNGALPNWAVLANCEISGTPPLLASGTTQSISAPFTVTITDSANPANTVSGEMAIVVKQPSITLQTNVVVCTVDVYCNANLIAGVSGGTEPYHFQSDTFRNGTPPWGTVVGVDGFLIGIPTLEGTYTFGVCAVDVVALSKCEQATAIIEPAEENQITLLLNTATCTVNEYCLAILITDASGGTPPYSFQSGSGTLPAGTAVDIFGTLTGTPTTEGTYTFEVCAVDSAGLSKCEQTSVVVEENPLTLLTGTATCSVDEYCDEDLILDVAGGNPPYYFELGSGTLPEGTAIDIEGTLTGFPTTEGTYVFEVCAVDLFGSSVCEEATAIIGPSAETTYTGTFSMNSNFYKPIPDYGTTCTFADTFAGTITLHLTNDAEGAVSGTADVEATFTSYGVAGSTAVYTCLDSQVPWSDSVSVSGTTSALEFSASFITAGGSLCTGPFSGSVSGDSISGTMGFTCDCCSGSASGTVTLNKTG